MYYSWSILTLRITADLDVDQSDIGGVFGLFSMLYQRVVGLVVPIDAWMLARYDW